jgi:hypothetical protein
MLGHKNRGQLSHVLACALDGVWTQAKACLCSVCNARVTRAVTPSCSVGNLATSQRVLFLQPGWSTQFLNKDHQVLFNLHQPHLQVLHLPAVSTTAVGGAQLLPHLVDPGSTLVLLLLRLQPLHELIRAAALAPAGSCQPALLQQLLLGQSSAPGVCSGETCANESELLKNHVMGEQAVDSFVTSDLHTRR